MRVLAVALIALPGLLFGHGTAAASCVQRTTPQLIEAADAIAAVSLADDLQAVPYPREITLRVRTVLKGTLPALVRVRIGPEMPPHGLLSFGFTSVDWRPTPGDHVVYLRIRDGYETDECAGDHPGPPAPEESNLLGPGVAPTAASLADFAALGVLPFLAAGVFVPGIVLLVRAKLLLREGRTA